MKLFILLVCVNSIYAYNHIPPIQYEPDYYLQDLISSNAQLEVYAENAEKDYTLSLDDKSQVWKAPPYTKSLRDFDTAINILAAHLVRSTNPDPHIKDLKYLVLINTVNSFADEVARHGWNLYNRHYQSMIRKYIEEVNYSPVQVVQKLKCAGFSPIHNAIEKVRQLMAQSVIQYICASKPSSCDAVIWSNVFTGSDIATKKSAQALLVAGKPAALFIESFANAFEVISEQDVYKYLMSSKEELRKLVASVTEARKNILGHERSNCDYNHRPSLDYQNKVHVMYPKEY